MLNQEIKNLSRNLIVERARSQSSNFRRPRTSRPSRLLRHEMLENVSSDQPFSVFYVMLHYTMAVMMQVAIFLNGTNNPTTLTDMPVERQQVNVYEFMWSLVLYVFVFIWTLCAVAISSENTRH